VATVKIAMTDDAHPHGAGRFAVWTPYSEEIVATLKGIPGRRWDKDGKVNTFPKDAQQALWAAFQKLFPGATAVGPKGPFVIVQAAPVTFKATV
jgi:hypothetical protein